MTTRWAMAAAALLALAACQEAPLADSAADPLRGVGFGAYESYLAERQAGEASASASDARAGGTAGVPGLTAADLAAAGIGVTASAGRTETAASVAAAAPPGTGAALSAARPQATGGPLGDPGARRAEGEQVITPAASPAASPARAPGAVPAERDGVAAADAMPDGEAVQGRPRTARAPGDARPAPERSTETGADIVAYALRTSNTVGQPLYRRLLASQGRAARQCRRFAGADLAQRAFLEAGGPYRDPLGLDPDGDGFVCGWNPAPFRAARG